MFKRVIQVFLAATLLCFFMNGALALESPLKNSTGLLRYTYTSNVYCGFSISSSGVASCDGDVYPKSGYSASVAVKLQQNDGGWKTIATWTGSGQAGKAASASGTKSVSAGYDYRVVVEGTVRNSSGTVVESPKVTSDTRHY